MMRFITKAMPIDSVNVKYDVKRLKTVELCKLAFWANTHFTDKRNFQDAISACYVRSNAKVLHISCNVGTRDLPDMYTFSPQACGP